MLTLKLDKKKKLHIFIAKAHYKTKFNKVIKNNNLSLSKRKLINRLKQNTSSWNKRN